MNLDYLKAKEEMLTASIDDCQHFFEENNFILESAYCKLLSEKPVEAEELFKQAVGYDVRAQWGVFISGLVQGAVNSYPTYFQLRNFLEIDLNLFLKYYLGDYIENIVKYADWLYTINPEVHKFIGRVFLKNNYEDYALFFLNRAKDYFFQDPELHYLLAEFYADKKDLVQANHAIQNCLAILPQYYPALELQRKLKLNCKD